MDIEELALKMRLRAIKIEDEEVGNLKEKQEKLIKQRKIENLQKLYFNAGRWAGGARDRAARQAFERISIGA